MDIIYYRKAAEIMLRDGADHDRAVAARVLIERNPRASDKRSVKSWMYQWIEQHAVEAAINRYRSNHP